MHADVLLIREGDDAMMTTAQDASFQAARPTTLTVDLQARDPADLAASFVHGTVSEAGRTAYGAAIGAFADRAVAAHRAEASARRSGCARTGASTTEAGMTTVRRALRCLARKSTAARHLRSGAWKRTSRPMRGQVDAARIWSSLLATRDGRRALAATSRVRSLLTVRLRPRSQVTLRVTGRACATARSTSCHAGA